LVWIGATAASLAPIFCCAPVLRGERSAVPVSNQSVARRKRGGNHDFHGLELNRGFHRL
jgi:hypothetical protein